MYEITSINASRTSKADVSSSVSYEHIPPLFINITASGSSQIPPINFSFPTSKQTEMERGELLQLAKELLKAFLLQKGQERVYEFLLKRIPVPIGNVFRVGVTLYQLYKLYKSFEALGFTLSLEALSQLGQSSFFSLKQKFTSYFQRCVGLVKSAAATKWSTGLEQVFLKCYGSVCSCMEMVADKLRGLGRLWDSLSGYVASFVGKAAFFVTNNVVGFFKGGLLKNLHLA